MDRRLIIVLVGLALALLGPGIALAQAPVPAPSLPPVPPVEPAPLPAEALPPAAAMPPPNESPAPAQAPRDSQVEQAQAPVLGARPSASKGAGLDHGPLSPAIEVPGQAGSAASAGSVDPFVLPPEKLPLGRQSVALTVDVVAPQVLNLNQIATLQIVVRNTGTTDATGVVVRDELPESLDFLSSQPEAERTGAMLFWKLATVPAGSEKKISVRVKTIKTGEFDHAATVTMLAGSKSRTTVREPKLKVEQTATSGKVLKGQPVTFKITISNPGDGPARNVVVQAKLSPGLRHESGEPNDQNLFEQTLDQIEPHQRVVLDALVADTLLAGEQSCVVVAQSTDVTTSRDDAKSVATVTVIEPKLKVTLTGDDKRFTDTNATYNLTIKNPGSATAYNVYVAVSLPLSGKPVGQPPSGGRWDPSIGKLLLKIPQVEPGENEKIERTFQVRMGGVGNYTVTVDARADGGLSDHTNFRTDVSGLADFEFEVREERRVVDVGDTTMFSIVIKNIGTKDATNVLVSAWYSKNTIEPIETKNGTDDRTQAKYNPETQQILFPAMERLGPGKEVVLGIRVKAIAKGVGICRVGLMHDDVTTQDERLEDLASFKITTARRP
jgi:uncharacterized repeat protein (TIGR01451 family)